jgi:uncharacterized protein (TIGR03083 family)
MGEWMLMSEPILCAHLLRRVDGMLVDLLRALRPEEWDLPTVAGAWRVRDVAAHLLDTALRKLSLARDGWIVEQPEIRSTADLAAFVNRLNGEGVAVFRRLSPAVLTAMLEDACRQSADFHESLDPFAPALFGVSWAGEAQSLNWFDTARELTERWHHQQQIRLATGRPGLMVRELYYPVLDCFLRGLPHAYREVEAPVGTQVRVEIAGDCGGVWQLRREAGGWDWAPAGPEWEARAVAPQEIAWRLFTRGIAREEAEARMEWSGDRPLASRVLDLLAIVG